MPPYQRPFTPALSTMFDTETQYQYRTTVRKGEGVSASPSNLHGSDVVTRKMSHSPKDSTPKTPATVTPVLEFAVIAQGQNEVVIQHNGKEYRLKTTRNGGLILNR